MKKQNTVIEQINVEMSMPSKVFDCIIALLVVPEIIVALNFSLVLRWCLPVFYRRFHPIYVFGALKRFV